MQTRYLVGIDEAGRGPIAGPVAVGAVIVPVDFKHSFFEGIRDSKQLPQHKREEWFAKLYAARDRKELNFAVSYSTPQYIDKTGISAAITRAIERALRRLKADPAETRVLLDGALQAPRAFSYQETIVNGDAREPLIALASIAAKVTRDRKMIAASGKFPPYGFEQHKGYGTEAHYKAIQDHGLCTLHRKSFVHPQG